MIDKTTFEETLQNAFDEKGLVSGPLTFEENDAIDETSVFINVTDYYSMYKMTISFDEKKGEVEVVLDLGSNPQEELEKCFETLVDSCPNGFSYDKEKGVFFKKYQCNDEGEWAQRLLEDHESSFFFFRAVWAMSGQHDDDSLDNFSYTGMN